jgi:hypothetical protein
VLILQRLAGPASAPRRWSAATATTTILKTPTIYLLPGLPDLRQFTYGTTTLQMSDLITQVLRASQHRFIGRMARDPELRSFDSGNCVCNARILINKPGAKRDDGQEPDGFKLEIWGEKAQAFTDATRKGDLVDVTGRVKSESWTIAPPASSAPAWWCWLRSGHWQASHGRHHRQQLQPLQPHHSRRGTRRHWTIRILPF